jgi:hypothetical protein
VSSLYLSVVTEKFLYALSRIRRLFVQCIASSVVLLSLETCSNNSPSSSGAFRVSTRAWADCSFQASCLSITAVYIVCKYPQIRRRCELKHCRIRVRTGELDDLHMFYFNRGLATSQISATNKIGGFAITQTTVLYLSIHMFRPR